jgi:large subunit ribosomal protein L4
MLRHASRRGLRVVQQGVTTITEQVAATRVERHRSLSCYIVGRPKVDAASTLSWTTLTSGTSSLQPSPQVACSSSRMSLFSTLKHDDEDDADSDDAEFDGGMPSNLRFDRRSSFAPQKPPSTILVPKKALQKTGIKNDEDAATEQQEGAVVEEHQDDTVGDSAEEEEEDGSVASIAEVDPQSVIPLPDRLRVNVHDVLDGGSVNGTLWLNPTVFGVSDIRLDLIQQNVVYIRNKIRGIRKTKTKTVSEVSGSGKKVRNQKGTGRARAGHSRPAHWRGGAKAHGPKQVDYGDCKMNKKARRLAMASTLSQKLKEGNLIVVDHLRLPTHKTKEWTHILESAFGISMHDDGSSALILDHFLVEHETELEQEQPPKEKHVSLQGVPINVSVASGNLLNVKVANQRFANVYEILKKDKLMITLSALQQMEAKWSRD